MPKPITNEERRKIIKHKQNGAKEADIAKWFFISKVAVSKIWSEYKKTNNSDLKYANCGRHSEISPEDETKIYAKIEQEPDTTLLEMIEMFALHITESGLSKWLKKRGYSFKKRSRIQQSKTDQMCKQCGANLSRQ